MSLTCTFCNSIQHNASVIPEHNHSSIKSIDSPYLVTSENAIASIIQVIVSYMASNASCLSLEERTIRALAWEMVEYSKTDCDFDDSSSER